MNEERLTAKQMLELSRFTTPTVYNGWEQITRHNAAAECFNLEEAIDFTPQLGAVAGFAVTAVVEVSSDAKRDTNTQAWSQFRRYVAEQPGPKIIVVQDMDKPTVVGSIWGEISANIYRGLGCIGTITDGGVRDIDEMAASGFKALARRLCVGHGHGALLRWGCDVNVFGCAVQPRQLIHADKHGFLAVPREDEPRLLDATSSLDIAEKQILQAARQTNDTNKNEYLRRIEDSIGGFIENVRSHFKGRGEW